MLENPCDGSNIKHLTADDRSVQHKNDTNKCDGRDPEIANDWQSWYRVSGNAGNALAAIDAPPMFSCGSQFSIYLKRKHPAPGDAVVNRTIHIKPHDLFIDPRVANMTIKVINCGEFYLYKLVKVFSDCNTTWRYCTNGQG